MFDLKSPCVNCPFRKGMGSRFRLSPGRLAEIQSATAFQCHKTVHYDAEPDNQAARAGDRPQQCAGLMAVLAREDRPNQIMQIAVRLGALDVNAFDPRAEAYTTWRDVCAAHGGNEP